MIKTQKNRNLVANGLGVLCMFLVNRLLRTTKMPGEIEMVLTFLSLPIIPVLYALAVARRNKQPLTQHLKRPEASIVTNSFIFYGRIALSGLALIFTKYSWRYSTEAVRTDYLLPDSFGVVLIVWGFASFVFVGGLRERHLWQQNMSHSTKSEDEDGLDTMIGGALLFACAGVVLGIHLLAEIILKHPVQTVSLNEGWALGLLTLAAIVLAYPYEKLSKAIARRIRQRQAK